MNKPKANQYLTAHGMHTAMREWANSQQKKELQVTVKFSDSDDVFSETFVRAKKEVEYKTQDGEIYCQAVDSSKFVNQFLPGDYALSAKEIKAAFNEWIKPIDPTVSIVYIRWAYVQA